MGDLISRKLLLDELNKNKIPYNSDVNYFIMHAETAYDVDSIVKELKQLLSDVNFEKSTKDVNESFYDGMSFAYNKAVEIVQKGAVATDDVCKWRAMGANDNWSTSCDKRSIHNVFGVAWFKRCPYCGRKIRVV